MLSANLELQIKTPRSSESQSLDSTSSQQRSSCSDAPVATLGPPRHHYAKIGPENEKAITVSGQKSFLRF